MQPHASEDRGILLHRCVKSFTDSLLDLLVAPLTSTPAIAASSADPSKPADADADESPPAPPTPPESTELLYLGPDENITPVDIDWIVAHAARRGYSQPAAFMSSKPREGINHKEFGVTSEGVAVFLAEALRSIGVRPDAEPWTVKLTGGPDGDVAGNMLKILHREYGDHVKVVGMADGSGCAEDPEGLPMGELLRLFDRALPLSR